MIQAGKFIVLEGIDGAGTTTQGRLLVDWLRSVGRRATLTCEPSGGPVGSLLRQILSGRVVARGSGESASPVGNGVIALLFAADRLDHLDSEVVPLLESGSEVVSDRYYHSSFTYQALEGDPAWIRNLNALARAPDVTYLLDVPAAVAALRRQRVRTSEDLYEKDATQERLEQAYRALPALLPAENIVVVDGTQEVPAVHRAIIADLGARFGWGKGS